ncbi:hypothetical protein THF1C08_260080 [Vibrio jasicida]|nr:hypothetical protein THF1C08_260080 [Vibrio jasicida]
MALETHQPDEFSKTLDKSSLTGVGREICLRLNIIIPPQ